jgi:hypothetical protein
MSPATVQQRKKHAHSLHVPVWYYAVLGGIVVLGILLILLASPSARSLGSKSGQNEQGDYYLGNSYAPVTIIEWGSPT